jgi:type III restriction enzyme
MIRTPLARHVDADEFLNSVSLYLPHYDREGLDRILSKLQDPDPSIMPPIRVEPGKNILTLKRNRELAECFTAAEQIPSYTVSATRKTTNVRRVMKLARLLANDGIVPEAIAQARSMVLTILEAERVRLEGSEHFMRIVKESGVIDLRGVEYAYADGITRESSRQVTVSQDNIDDLFSEAGRKIGEGLHKAYWKARSESDPSSARRRAKLELFALVHDRDTLKRIEEAAAQRLRQWQDDNQPAINRLPPDRQDGYHQVAQTAVVPEPHQIALPHLIQGKRAESHWKSHLYIGSDGEFPYDFKSSWEPMVIEAEMARSDFVGFLRNEDRKRWALCIPYKVAGADRPFYPDFLTFRQGKDGIITDILDPHASSLADWWQKAVGLAQYASSHARLFGRIELIVIERDEIIRLDLKDEGIRNRVRAVTNNGHLNDLLRHQ